MKRVSLVILAIFNLATSSAQPAKQYRLEVTLQESLKKGRAYLRYFTENGPMLDSVNFNKGKFVFVGTVPDKLTVAKIYLLEEKEITPKKENSCEVWLEPGEIKIETKKDLINAGYDGSTLQKQFSELQKTLLPVKLKNYVLDEAYENAEAKKDVAGKDILLNESYPALYKERQQVLGVFIRKYPSSLISAYKFDEFAGDGEMDLAIVEPVYELLYPEIKHHSQVEKTAKRIAINKRTAPGMVAIEFSQADTSGRQVTLSSFRGKWLLVDFWAGWCVPCRAENPHLIKMYELYSNRGFDILGVSLDGERKRWTNAIVTDKLVWTQVSDLEIFDNRIAKQYGITSIPQNILVGPDGKILAKNLRGTALENKLGEIFK